MELIEVTPDPFAAHSDPQYQCARCHQCFHTPTAVKDHMVKHSEEDTFDCDVCNKTFSSHGNLYRHKKLHNSSKPYPCDVCQKSYCSKAYLKAHSWEHVSERPFRCEICDKRFPLLLHLKRHVVIHSTKPHVCEICNRRFTSVSNLKRHELTHVVYECQVCGKQYPKLYRLKHHLEEHLEEKPFSCDKCDRHFVSEVLLRAHTWVHTREKKSFFCKTCPLKFELSRQLKKHNLEVHDDEPTRKRKKKTHPAGCGNVREPLEEAVAEVVYERPDSPEEPLQIKYVYEAADDFQCGVCGKTFKTRRIQKQHELLHEGTRPFPCDVCGVAFSTRTNMTRHRKLHDKRLPYACSVCDKTYKTAGSLKTHMWDHSDVKPYECTICKKKFSQHLHVRRHMIIHDKDKRYKCDHCPMTFSQSQNMKRHQGTHFALLKHQCQVCGSKFKTVGELRSHMADHDGMRNYECKLCHKKYATEANLKGHMWTHAEKRFYCKKCNRRFASSFFLRRHMTSHDQQEKETAFQCEICLKRFLKMGNFNAHVATHSRMSAPKCPACHVGFFNHLLLDNHVKRKHPDSSLFACEFCQETFHLTKHREKHVDAKHAEKARPFKCDKCAVSFRTQDAATAHQTLHGVEKPFRCQSCDLCFPSKLKFAIHSRTHRDVFTCQHCKEVFPTLGDKISHQQSASDNAHKPFACASCLKRFTSKQRLERHVRTHTGERPYPCPHCQKRFGQMAHLKEHLGCHNGGKAYVCNICSKGFSHPRSLPSHVDLCMQDVLEVADADGEPRGPVQCDDCNERFDSEVDRQSHVDDGTCPKTCICGCEGDAEKHNDGSTNANAEVSSGTTKEGSQFGEGKKQSNSADAASDGEGEGSVAIVTRSKRTLLCETCKKIFLTLPKLKRHIQGHCIETPYKCGLCDNQDAVFAEMTILVRHVKEHLLDFKKFSCYLCGTNFPHLQFYKSHMQQHKLADHPCPHCELRFIRKGKLALHVRTKHSERYFEGNAASVMTQMDDDMLNLSRIKTEPIDPEEGATMLAALSKGGNSYEIDAENDVTVTFPSAARSPGPQMVSTGTCTDAVSDVQHDDEPMEDASARDAGELVQFEVASIADALPDSYEIVAVMDNANAQQLCGLAGVDQILYSTDGQIMSTGNPTLDDAVRIISTGIDDETIIIKIEYEDS